MTHLLMILAVLGTPRPTEKPAGPGLILTEEVRFGAVEADDAYLWTGLQTKVLPAPDGGMFVFDQAASRVLLFDGQGRFVRRVARKGEGPGELRYVLSATRTADGHILVLDTTTPGNVVHLKRFAPDMTFLDERPTSDMGLMPHDLTVSPDGRYLGGRFVTFQQEGPGLAHKTGVLRLADNALVLDFYNAVEPLPTGDLSDQGAWRDLIAVSTRQRFRQGMMAWGADGTVYAATADVYDIRCYTPEARKPFRVIRHAYRPKLFTDQDLEDLVAQQYDNMSSRAKEFISRQAVAQGFAKADLKVHAPLVCLIALEDQGVLAVRTAGDAGRANRADVFDREGRFLGEVTVPDAGLAVLVPGRATPFVRMTFHEGKAYAVHLDAEGEQVVVRYAYRPAAP